MIVRRGGFREVALRVLWEARRPLTAKEIIDIATARGILKTTGKTPGNTMYSVLIREGRTGSASEFAKSGNGQFELTEAGRKRAEALRLSKP